MAARGFYDLDRFVLAQGRRYDLIKAEIASGRKVSHWMWFVFPQLKGLGNSMASDFYGIATIAEASDYLAHPVLGSRLRECVELLLVPDKTNVFDVFSDLDVLKLRSCLTLFDAIEPNSNFRVALERLFQGRSDTVTVKRVRLLKIKRLFELVIP